MSKRFLKRIGQRAGVRNVHHKEGLHSRRPTLAELEEDSLAVAPRVEGRVQQVTPARVAFLDKVSRVLSIFVLHRIFNYGHSVYLTKYPQPIIISEAMPSAGERVPGLCGGEILPRGPILLLAPAAHQGGLFAFTQQDQHRTSCCRRRLSLWM